jgi:hypothetical protein
VITQAQQSAQEWIAAWNAHDLEAIMEHYADNIEFSSPFIVKAMDISNSTIRGKENLRGYFQKALENNPQLHFELYTVFVRVNSVTLHYLSRSRNLLAAEVLFFDEEGKIVKGAAHYSPVEERL